MMFRPHIHRIERKVATQRRPRAVLLSALVTWAGIMGAGQALAEVRVAVVPKRIIYPGEQLAAAQLEEVKVTNPNLMPGYAQRIEAINGLITKKTLLPGRIILVSALREPYAVSRGAVVRLIFENGPLMITASGTPLQDAAVGELIRVRNTDSGVIVAGTVMEDGTVRVVAK